MLDQPRETVLGCTVVRVECVRPVPDLATMLIRKSTPRHVRWKLSTHVDGGLSGGSIMRRPGSEDPHGRELKVDLWRAIDDQIYFVNSYFLSTFKCWSIIVLDAVQVLQYQDIII